MQISASTKLLTLKTSVNSTLIALYLGAGGFASAQTSLGHYVYTANAGVELMPPTRVADDTDKLTWAPDSLRLISFNIHRLSANTENGGSNNPFETESDFSLGRWNRLTQKSDIFYKRRFPTIVSLFSEAVWLPKTSVLLQPVYWVERNSTGVDAAAPGEPVTQKTELLWIDTVHSVVHEVRMDTSDMVYVSPSRPIALMVHAGVISAGESSAITQIQPDGTMGATFRVDHKSVFAQRWSADGAKLYVMVLTLGADRAHRVKSFAEYDPVAGSFNPIKELPKTPDLQPTARHEIAIKSTQQHIRDADVDTPVSALFAVSSFASNHSRMLICADADSGILSPDGKVVAYRAQGSSWIAPLKSYPLEEFKVKVAIAQRATAMSNAKQLGLAIIMYAADMDETLPPQGDIQNLIKPYLLNDSLFQGFEYTYTGGPLSHIASPAETQLGYVETSGGRAVIFSDGHVKWQGQP